MTTKNLQIIRAKTVQNMCQVSKSTALKIIKDIKEEYNIKTVTYFHLTKYLKIN